jgi:hypothetical protein
VHQQSSEQQLRKSQATALAAAALAGSSSRTLERSTKAALDAAVGDDSCAQTHLLELLARLDNSEDNLNMH